MFAEPIYKLTASKWEKNGKTRVYLADVCQNVKELDTATQRAHSRGTDYGFLDLDVAGGVVVAVEYCSGKRDVRKDYLAWDEAEFAAECRALIEGAGYAFPAPIVEAEAVVDTEVVADAAIVAISDALKGAIAEKIALQASAGYDKAAQGAWYTDGERLYHVETTAAWMPWSDGAAVVAVDELLEDGYDADPSVDWSLHPEEIATWRSALALDEDTDDRDVVYEASQSGTHSGAVAAIEQAAFDNAAMFILDGILDAMEV